MIKYGLIFVGGVATGLLIAKFYARSKAEDVIHEGLTKVGLGGGPIEEYAKKLFVPMVA